MKEDQINYLENHMSKVETKEEELLLGIRRSLFSIENRFEESTKILKWLLFMLIGITLVLLKNILG